MEPRPPLPEFSAAREAAPSILREDEPNFARILGMAGLFFLIIGIAVMVTVSLGKVSRINPSLGAVSLIFGVACLLFHASRDTDISIRRTYGLFGYACLLIGILVVAIPIRNLPIADRFLPWGFSAFTLALLFLMPFTRNETTESWRMPAIRTLGGIGALLALTGFVGSYVTPAFLLPYGMLLAILGLLYVWGFIGATGTANDLGYWSGLGLGVLGAVVFVAALALSIIGTLLKRGAATSYFTNSGAVLMLLGLLYVCCSAALCSDNRLVVLTRRELAGFFYSPIAYIVFFSLTLVGWLVYFQFANVILRASEPPRQGLLEPIVLRYILDWVPVICVSVVVPSITMRLLSEEKRSGTLEVLLTAPVGETTIVLSKFVAALIFFAALWIPWGLFLIALRMEGGQPFDYRPLVSFFIALVVSGAGFLAMGLFFSSLTRNQIISFILTFMGMILLLCVYFIARGLGDNTQWGAVLDYTSYIGFWSSSLEGKLFLRSLLVQASVAIFWLFLTIKVLESRKWK
jgi:ABC-type transport system involved in multi-copper enzyme maturation permease subunit